MVPKTILCSISNEIAKDHIFCSRHAKEVWKKQPALARQNEVVFWPCMEDLDATDPLQTKYCSNFYESNKREIRSSTNTSIVWKENCNEKISSFIGMRYDTGCTSKTATNLSANAIVAYSFHVVLLNFRLKFRRI